MKSSDLDTNPVSGVDLSLTRDMIFIGDTDQFGQLTCQASGNEATINSVTIMWVNVTGKSIDLLSVTADSPAGSLSLGGMNGTGSLVGNSGSNFIDRVSAADCDSSYFLCEVAFTKPTGESERAVAAAWPSRPQNAQSGLTTTEETLSDLSTAFAALNQSYSNLVEEMQEGKMVNANLSARITALEGGLSCDPCSSIYPMRWRMSKGGW